MTFFAIFKILTFCIPACSLLQLLIFMPSIEKLSNKGLKKLSNHACDKKCQLKYKYPGSIHAHIVFYALVLTSIGTLMHE